MSSKLDTVRITPYKPLIKNFQDRCLFANMNSALKINS